MSTNVCILMKCLKATILCEFGRGELSRNPQCFLGATLEDEARRNVGAAIKVILTARQAQIQSMVAEGCVLITLKNTFGSKDLHPLFFNEKKKQQQQNRKCTIEFVNKWIRKKRCQQKWGGKENITTEKNQKITTSASFPVNDKSLGIQCIQKSGQSKI